MPFTPLNPQAMPATPRGRVRTILILSAVSIGAVIAIWLWFRADRPWATRVRDALLEARQHILLAEIELSFGPCAETVPNGIRAFAKDRSTELAMPIALASPLSVNFERQGIARRPPSDDQSDDWLMTGGDRVNPARIWDRADGRVLSTFEGSDDNDGPAVLSNDGARVYIGSRPDDPGVWPMRGGPPLGMPRLDSDFAIQGASFTRDGNGLLLYADINDINTNALIAWDIARGATRVLAQGCGGISAKLNDDDTEVTVSAGGCPGGYEERLATGFAASTGASAPSDAATRWDIRLRPGRPPRAQVARHMALARIAQRGRKKPRRLGQVRRGLGTRRGDGDRGRSASRHGRRVRAGGRGCVVRRVGGPSGDRRRRRRRCLLGYRAPGACLRRRARFIGLRGHSDLPKVLASGRRVQSGRNQSAVGRSPG